MTEKEKQYVLAKDEDFIVLEPEEPEVEPMTFSPMSTMSTMNYEEPDDTSGFTTMGWEDDDYLYIKDPGDYSGYRDGFLYRGRDRYVEIPHYIHGQQVTNYGFMFERALHVEAIRSTNPYVTSMGQMFLRFSSEVLDLVEFDTSNVDNMIQMFSRAEIWRGLNLSGFDTSKVTHMAGMFELFYVGEDLDLSHFDTRNVANMSAMFSNSRIPTLDLSGFDMSNVEFTDNMFGGAQINIVYTRTQGDADIMSNSLNANPDIEFVVKREVVSTETQTQEIPIPYTTDYVDDPYLAEGEEELIYEGVEGLKRETYEVTTYDDGSTTSELINTEVLQEPLSKVIYVGVAVVDTVETITEESSIPFGIERVEVDTLYQGEEEIVQEGVNGTLIETIEVTTFTNGETYSEVIDATETDPVTQIIHVGTKIAADTEIVDTPIPYETEYVEDDRYQEGRESVVQHGVNGYDREVYEITRRADGTETRELVLTQTVEPVTRIVRIGTGASKHWLTEVYLMGEKQDRDYFVDRARTNPMGICERYGVTLRERPSIPTAHMRYDETNMWKRAGDYASADNYDNVELVLHFNYLSDKENGREAYNRLANALNALEPGTRLRFSDDKDGAFRKLARKPFIEALNNDLAHWGDFEVRLVLEPFRYVEQKEIELPPNVNTTLTQPLPDALKSPQRVEHRTQKGTELTMIKNNNTVYRVADTNRPVIITDASIPYTFGGRNE